MNSHPTRLRGIALLSVGVGLLMAAAPIQPAGAQPDDRPRDAAPQPEDRDALRERIQHQLDALREREGRLEQALDLLDDGAPADEVRRAAMPDRAEEFMDRRGRRDDRRRGGFDGPPGAHAGSADGADRDAPPSPAQIDREFLQSHNPEIAADLETLRERDPEAFQEKLASIAPRVERVMGEAEERPERFRLMMQFRRLERRAHDLARRLVENDNPDNENLTLELREAVAEGFDLRQRLHATEIERTRERLDELESRAEEWSTNREQMIDRHVAELIDRATRGEPLPTPRDRFRKDFETRREGRQRSPGAPLPRER